MNDHDFFDDSEPRLQSPDNAKSPEFELQPADDFDAPDSQFTTNPSGLNQQVDSTDPTDSTYPIRISDDSVPLPFVGKWSDALRRSHPELSITERAQHGQYLDSFAKSSVVDGYTLAAIKVENGQMKIRLADYRERLEDE